MADRKSLCHPVIIQTYKAARKRKMQRLTKHYSLFDLEPNLKKEWHPSLNGKLTPQNVKIGKIRKSDHFLINFLSILRFLTKLNSASLIKRTFPRGSIFSFSAFEKTGKTEWLFYENLLLTILTQKINAALKAPSESTLRTI